MGGCFSEAVCSVESMGKIT
ncbi:hypothetical protein MXB_1618 [Myxobolus squamalis]|nr:hypothetical protein MXB_1618 [Myxobolus squamalis]